MSETLMPEGVKVLVEPEKVPEKTDGGIYRPNTVIDNERYATTTGTIVAIGPRVDVHFDNGPLAIGDKVMFAKYGGVIVERSGKTLRALNDEDIILRIETGE